MLTTKTKELPVQVMERIKKWAGRLIVERHKTIAGIIRLLLSRNRDKTALVQGERRLTYQELSSEVYACVSWLENNGIQPGDRVALILPDSIEYIVVRLACWLCGIETVLLMDTVSQDHFDHMLDTAHPCGAVIHENIGIDTRDIKVLRFSLGNAGRMDRRIVMPRQESTASVNYSSGSTGMPKGILLTQKSWAASCHAFVRAAGASGEKGQDVYLSVIPMAVAGSTSIIPVLLGGMRIVIAGTHDPVRIAELIEEEHVSLMFLTPAWFAQLTDHVAASHTDISGLRKIALGTDTVHASLVKKGVSVYGPVITCSYGMAEVLPPLTILEKPDYMKGGVLDESLLHSVGKPYPHVKIDIIDSDGHVLGPGSQGNIRVVSPSAAQGYTGAPEEEKKRFRSDGSFLSEDIGYFDERGYLYILGREGHRINITGSEEVFARKIEDICLEQDSVISACAVSLEDKAGVVYRMSEQDPGTASSEDIERTWEEKIGMPAVFRQVEQMPVTSAGKLDRTGAARLFRE